MGTQHLDFKPGGRVNFFDFKKDILNSAWVFGPIKTPTLSFTYFIRGEMVQPRYLLAWTIIVAVISLNCDNCNAAIVKSVDRKPAMDLSNLDDMDKWLEDDEDDIDDLDDINDDDDLDLDDLDKWLDNDSNDLNMLDRALSPTKWLKRQVRQLWRALANIRPKIKANEDAIDSLEADVDMNKMGIQTNSKNITDNEDDIGENVVAIGENLAEIEMNEEKIENLNASIHEKFDLHAELIANNSELIANNTMMIEQNKMDIEANLNEILQLTNVPRQYLSFGGLDDENTVTEEVYLITVDELNNITTACNHSTLPSTLKESHAFEWDDTLLVCSSFRSGADKKRLDCYTWNGTGWSDFDTPALDGATGIQGAIQSVQIPGVGIWFTSAKGATAGDSSYLLQEDGTWVQKVWPNRPRTKGCMILYNNTHIAGIGGTVTGENSDKIDTYDFFIDEFKENVATLEFNRTQHQCALIPEGDNGHPTVVILGDTGQDKDGATVITPWAMEMTLWDTVTNEMTLIPHPPGYDGDSDTYRFPRPTMATWDQNTILLAASQVFEGDPATKTVLMEQWLYKFGEGWTSLGPIVPSIEAAYEFDIYMLDNMDLGAYDSLTKCADP